MNGLIDFVDLLIKIILLKVIVFLIILSERGIYRKGIRCL